MTTLPGRVLVAGATGLAGGQVTRRLLAAGIPVRALGRNREKLAALAAAGADVAEVDLLDLENVRKACEGVSQVFTTANNSLGRGASSPNRVDLRAHQNLCSAAREAGVQRLVYVSFRGGSATVPVDLFRIKYEIEEYVKGCGIPYVVIRPGAFMDIWVGMIVDSMRKDGTAILFGDGRRPCRFIAVEDVAAFAVRILEREDVRNETIDIGGPSCVSFDALVTLLEQRLNIKAKRRRIPKPVLFIGGAVLRPFNEVAARLMRMGYFTATTDQQFPEWRVAADRFGVSPMTVESFVQALPLA
jgi:uncharacterized protein YbjT (DUF2867 family)